MIIVSKYEVTGELDQGGMGLVYRVRHRELGAIFALKMLRATLSMKRKRWGGFTTKRGSSRNCAIQTSSRCSIDGSVLNVVMKNSN